MGARLAVVIFASVFPHFTALGASFTYDDRDFVVDNAAVRSLPTAWAAKTATFPPEHPSRGLYRPVTQLAYAVDHALFGEGALGFHVASLVFHAAVCLGLYLLLRKLTRHGALVGALVFATHPVHCEVVDSIAGRSELLGAGFILAAVAMLRPYLLASRAATALGWLAGMTAGMTAAMLAYEGAIVVVPILVLYGVLVPLGRDAHARLRFIGFALASGMSGAVALGMRLGVTARFGTTFLSEKPVDAKLFGALAAIAEQTRALVFPTLLDVDAYYQSAIAPARFTLRVGIGVVVLAVAIGLAALVLRRLRRSPRERPTHTFQPPIVVIALGVGVLGIGLVPSSPLVPLGIPVSERSLFVASAGLAIVLAGLFATLHRWTTFRRTALLATFGLLAVSAGRSGLRALDWQDDVTLFRPTSKRVADDHRVFTFLGLGYLRRHEMEAGERAFKKALALAPDSPRALSGYGHCLLLRGDLAGSRAVYTHLLAIRPGDAIAINNLGFLESRAGHHRKARAMYLQALAKHPTYKSALDNLKTVDEKLASAEAWRRKVEPRAPTSDDPMVHRTLARACFVLEDLPCMRRAYARALELAAAHDAALSAEDVANHPERLLLPIVHDEELDRLPPGP